MVNPSYFWSCTSNYSQLEITCTDQLMRLFDSKSRPARKRKLEHYIFSLLKFQGVTRTVFDIMFNTRLWLRFEKVWRSGLKHSSQARWPLFGVEVYIRHVPFLEQISITNRFNSHHVGRYTVMRILRPFFVALAITSFWCCFPMNWTPVSVVNSEVQWADFEVLWGQEKGVVIGNTK